MPNDPQKEFANNLGFKVYKLSKSNFPRCEFTPDLKRSDEENIAALRRYIHEKEAASLLPLAAETEQAVFDEVLLKCGFQLHYTRTLRADFTENTVYEVTDGNRSTLACLAWNESIRDELETHLAMLKRDGTIEAWHDHKILAGDVLEHVTGG